MTKDPTLERPPVVAQMLESEGPGGAEIVLLHLCEAMRARGLEVVPIVLTKRPPGWLEAQLAQRGFAPERAEIARMLDLRCARTLVQTLRRRGVTAIQSHEFGSAIYATAAARWIGIPHVITMHGNMWMTDAWRRRAALRWAFRRSRATVAVSRDTARHLTRALGLPADAVETIWNGVPVAAGHRDATRQQLGIPDGVPLLLAVGNLIERKGHAVLLRALARLRARAPHLDWRLVIAGEGVERPGLEALMAESHLADRVRLLGHRADIPDLQAAADIFVMPSIWEGLPLAILEAMFQQNAVVASDISGIPEAVPHGDAGLLTPPGDERALADALERVVADPSLRRTLADAARARAHRHFTVDAMTTAYLSRLGVGVAPAVPVPALV